MTSHYIRSKARRPDTPTLKEGDVEPDDVAPIAATHSETFVRSIIVATGEPGSVAAEPAGPMSAPIHPSPQGTVTGDDYSVLSTSVRIRRR